MSNNSIYVLVDPIQQQDVIYVPGVSSVIYSVTIRVRGVFEVQDYNGGVIINPYVRKSGIPVDSLRSQYYLTVNNETYYLNVKSAEEYDDYVYARDYTFTIQAEGGSSIILGVNHGDNLMNENVGENDEPVTLNSSGLLVTEPYDGQFVQIDITSVESFSSDGRMIYEFNGLELEIVSLGEEQDK